MADQIEAMFRVEHVEAMTAIYVTGCGRLRQLLAACCQLWSDAVSCDSCVASCDCLSACLCVCGQHERDYQLSTSVGLHG
jgi:hypothetical protein